MIASETLRSALRHEGYAKVAQEVLRNQGEYVGDFSSVADSVKSLAVKVAANLENENIVADGLHSFRRLQEL